MGYPNFGNVRTLTLPIPASDMTSAEYKEAFGIDLENIKLYDLILLCTSDKQVQPVLVNDTANMVLYTAEGAYSYNGGFAVVEGDSLVAKVVEQGTIENAKPIYFHPIACDINSEGVLAGRMCISILNNDSTPITSFAELVALVRTWGLAAATLNCNGVLKVDTKTLVITTLRITASVVQIWGGYSDGTTQTSSLDGADYSYPAFVDNVNKIN